VLSAIISLVFTTGCLASSPEITQCTVVSRAEGDGSLCVFCTAEDAEDELSVGGYVLQGVARGQLRGLERTMRYGTHYRRTRSIFHVGHAWSSSVVM
jgi:hypothetical protein